MPDTSMSRRTFLTWVLGSLSVLALTICGCGKKEEEKPTIPAEEPEMTEEEKMAYVLNNCICKDCPSYVECGENAGFCAVGKSKCIKEKKGCICPDCPVTTKMKLKWGYYCIAGSAKQLMEAEAKKG